MGKRLLVNVVLGTCAVLVHSIDIATKSPKEGNYCLTCVTDSDCNGYTAGNATSTCRKGQCTTGDGLFGIDCKCEVNADCHSGRCDGAWLPTCRPKSDVGVVCNEPSDCLSGICQNMYCAEEVLIEEDATIEPSVTVTQAPSPALDSKGSLLTCIGCRQDSQCNQGTCVSGLCTDSNGEHPPLCFPCKTHDDCSEDYFCDSSGFIGRSVKRCSRKKSNGGRCGRDEACLSGHCNILFKCDSTDPDHKLGPNPSSNASKERSRSGASPGIAIWGSIIGAIVIFAGCVFGLVCRKDKHHFFGFSECLGRRRRRTICPNCKCTKDKCLCDPDERPGCVQRLCCRRKTPDPQSVA
jgi:hypothetical protein